MGTLSALVMASYGVVGTLLLATGLYMVVYARRLGIAELQGMGLALSTLSLSLYFALAAMAVHPVSDALLLSGVGPYGYGDIAWASVEKGEVWATSGGVALVAGASGFLLVAMSLLGAHALALGERGRGLSWALLGLGLLVFLASGYLTYRVAELTIEYASLARNPVDVVADYSAMTGSLDAFTALRILVVIAAALTAAWLYYGQYKALGSKGDLYTALGILLLGVGFSFILFQTTTIWASMGISYTAAIAGLTLVTLLMLAGVALAFYGTRLTLKPAEEVVSEAEEAQAA